MKTIWKSMLALGVLTIASAGCSAAAPDSPSSGTSAEMGGGSSGEDAGTAAAPDAGETVPSQISFYFLTATSNGYSLNTPNVEGRAQSVSAVNFTEAGISDGRSLDPPLSTPGTVLAQGSIQGDTFFATEVYEALPGFAAAANEALYLVPPAGGDCGVAKVINTGRQTAYASIDVSAAAASFVDEAWLSMRVLNGTAVVAGSFEPEGSRVLDASAIFLRIPDTTTCPQAVQACAAGTVATFRRDAARCLVATGCVTLGPCPEFVPMCDPGYQLSRWPAQTNGCAAFACDPAFDPAPASL